MKKTLLILALCITCSGFAQLFVSNLSELHISDSIPFYTDVNVVNEGIIFLSAGKQISFTIDAGLDNSQGTIHFNDATLVIGSGGANASTSDNFVFNTNDEVKHVILNKNGGITTVTNGHLGIAETLKLESGSLSAGDKATLLNSNINVAQVLESTGGSANLRVERCIPAGQRAFRLISPSVTTTSSVYENWQENGTNPDGYGTHITGSLAGTDGFDATETGNPSMFIFNNLLENQGDGNAWSPIDNTNVNELEAGSPYRLFVRGDRNIDLTSNETPANETVLRAVGDLLIGDFNPVISAFDGNFNFIGNPYQAAVDFNQLDFSGDINTNYIYVWDAQLGETGAFVTIDLLDGSNTVGSNANEFIQPGQAFFVRNNLSVTTPPSITFTESSKQLEEEQLATFSTPWYSKLNLQLIDENEHLVDAVGLRFHESFQNEVNDADAGKLGNSGENMALMNSNQLLSIEQRAFPQENEEVQLFINNYKSEDYAFQLQLENWNSDEEIYIKDNYLETLTPISTEEHFSFSVDQSISESTSILRFELKFNNETLGDADFTTNQFSIYPNPAKDVLHISGVANKASIQIFDLLGKQVFSTKMHNPNEALDVSNLETGVYVVKVNDGEKSFTQKMIKK